MICGNCNRRIKAASGYVSGVSLGPVCLRNMVGNKSQPLARRSRNPLRVDQPELFEGEYYFDEQGEADRKRIEKEKLCAS